MFISDLGREDGMNGWETKDNHFKIESYVTLYLSAPKHIVGCFCTNVLNFYRDYIAR